MNKRAHLRKVTKHPIKDCIETIAEKMTFGGKALARTNQGVVFISGAIPGERAKIQITDQSSGCLHGQAVEILEPSPARRDPCCQFANVCGGCDWLHIEYESQLQFKRDILIDCLERIGKIKVNCDITLFPSPEFAYRHRAQFKVDRKRAIGFYKRNTNDIVEITECPLLVRELNNFLSCIRDSDIQLQSDVKSIKLLLGNKGLASYPAIEGLTSDKTIIAVDDKVFNVKGDSFFQSNKFLLSSMAAWCKPKSKVQNFMDLFGGIGFFSIMLSDSFNSGILVESVDEQVLMAQKNFESNKIKHIQALSCSVESLRNRQDFIETKYDCILMDPPRPGLTREAREFVGKLAPDTLIYISCNPSTMARDLQFFTSTCSYKIDEIALFDLYPNTYHLETGVKLSKS